MEILKNVSGSYSHANTNQRDNGKPAQETKQNKRRTVVFVNKIPYATEYRLLQKGFT